MGRGSPSRGAGSQWKILHLHDELHGRAPCRLARRSVLLVPASQRRAESTGHGKAGEAVPCGRLPHHSAALPRPDGTGRQARAGTVSGFGSSEQSQREFRFRAARGTMKVRSSRASKCPRRGRWATAQHSAGRKGSRPPRARGNGARNLSRRAWHGPVLPRTFRGRGCRRDPTRRAAARASSSIQMLVGRSRLTDLAFAFRRARPGDATILALYRLPRLSVA